MSVLFRLLAAQDIDSGRLPKVQTDAATVSNIMEVTFAIVGALALLMVTLSGLRYITSGGDPEKTSRAKSGLTYSLIGLVVAITAEAIVVFIVKRL